MAVTEQQRHQLLAWFEERMGEERAATMMELLPPADRSELATKADLALVRADVAGLRAEFKADLIGVQRTFGTWLFTSQAAVVAMVAVLLATVR